MSDDIQKPIEGGCLCEGVRYRIDGNCRDIINCHCQNCRRTHGHIAAYTSVNKSDLELLQQESLQWYHDQSPDTYRGFCNICGASLFWDARDGRDKLAVAAGSLDDSRDLKTIGNIYVAEAGHYYELEDSLPKFNGSSGGMLESDANS